MVVRVLREKEICEVRRKKEEKEGPRERARGRPGAAAAAGPRRAAGLRRVRREELVREGPGDAVAGDGGGAARGRTSRGGRNEEERRGVWLWLVDREGMDPKEEDRWWLVGRRSRGGR